MRRALVQSLREHAHWSVYENKPIRECIASRSLEPFADFKLLGNFVKKKNIQFLYLAWPAELTHVWLF